VDDRVGDEELAELARGFNRMSRELHRLYTGLEDEVRLKGRQLARSQRLAGLGFLAAGIAHEINNPLAAMSFYAESAQQRLREATASSPAGADRHALAAELVARLDKALTVVREEADRCKLITDRLLALARPGSSRRGAVDLHEVAGRAIEVAQGMPALEGVRIRLAPHAGPPVLAWADASELVQVALNLVCNAMEAVGREDGMVEVACERAGDWVRMRVSDNGRGMSPQVLERVFEPFFTDKPRRGLASGPGGTGLGLTVAHAIVEQHGGRLSASSEGPGRGSVFTVELPPASAQEGPVFRVGSEGEGLAG
jgi:signal transduction histidine kinase